MLRADRLEFSRSAQKIVAPIRGKEALREEIVVPDKAGKEALRDEIVAPIRREKRLCAMKSSPR